MWEGKGGKEPAVTLAGGSLFARKIYVLASNIYRLEHIGGSNLFARQIYAGSSRMSLANMLTYMCLIQRSYMSNANINTNYYVTHRSATLATSWST
jgi:hypothetical protein